jgi:hypothetical protein
MKITNSINTDGDVKAKARTMLEEQGDDIGDEAMLAIMDLFKQDVENAHMYIGFKRESLRKRWVRRELAKMNFTLDDPPS